MKLRINEYEIYRKAEQMDEQRKLLNNIINRLSELLENIGTVWQGPASETTKKKLELFLFDVKQTEEKLERYIELVRWAAQKIRKEEEQLTENLSRR